MLSSLWQAAAEFFACCDSVSSCCVTELWAFGSAVIQLPGTGTTPYPAPLPEETRLTSSLIRIGMQLSLLITKTNHQFPGACFPHDLISTYTNCILQCTIAFLVAPCSFQDSDFCQFYVALAWRSNLMGQCHVKPILMHLPTCRKK